MGYKRILRKAISQQTGQPRRNGWKTNIVWSYSFICGILKNEKQRNKKSKQMYRYRKESGGYQKQRGLKEDETGKGGWLYGDE